MKDDPPNSTDSASSRGLRTGLGVEDIKQSFLDSLFYSIGRVPSVATRNDLYTALALTVRDMVFHHAEVRKGMGLKIVGYAAVSIPQVLVTKINQEAEPKEFRLICK